MSDEFQTIVRERMSETGEKYTTAQRAVLAEFRTGKRVPPAVLPRIAAQYPDGKGEVLSIDITRPVNVALYGTTNGYEAAGRYVDPEGDINICFTLDADDNEEDAARIKEFISADENGRLTLIDEWTEDSAEQITTQLECDPADGGMSTYSFHYLADAKQHEVMEMADWDTGLTVDQIAWLLIVHPVLLDGEDEITAETWEKAKALVATKYTEFNNGQH